MQTDKKKQVLVQSQLTLRAIIWDVTALIVPAETDKLDQEIKAFTIYKILTARIAEQRAVRKEKKENNRVERQNKQRLIREQEKPLPATRDKWTVYQCMKKQLHKKGISMQEAVLVTDDGTLADYVYHCQRKEADLPVYGKSSGMAVVYYERVYKRKKVYADFIVQGFEEIGIQFFDRVQKRRNCLPWSILYTKRTCVREITIADLDELYDIYQVQGMTDYIEPLYEREMEEQYTKNYIRYMYYYYGYGMWIVQDRETGMLIGRAGIEHRDRDDQVWMELGYVIRKEYQNQGYATEVCMAILDYAKQELEMEDMHCFIHKDNLASIRVVEKLGFVFDGNTCDTPQDTRHFYKKLLVNDS